MLQPIASRCVVENHEDSGFLPNQIDFCYRQTSRVVNIFRPTWHTHADADQQEPVILRIPSGYDYIRHFSSLVLHYLKARISSPQDLITIKYELLTTAVIQSSLDLILSTLYPLARLLSAVVTCCLLKWLTKSFHLRKMIFIPAGKLGITWYFSAVSSASGADSPAVSFFLSASIFSQLKSSTSAIRGH